MLFTDSNFFAFLGVVFSLYYLPLLARFQIHLLLVASLCFYALDQPWLLILLILSATITTFTSHRVLHADSTSDKRIWAATGVTANLCVLGFFKYGGLFYRSFIGAPTGLSALLLSAPLPIGISFYTFHGISLLVDLFRMGPKIVQPRESEPKIGYGERSFLYLTFFPQLIAGPIVKAREFFPQMHGHKFGGIDWTGASKALLIGYFLKSVIADNLQEQTFWLQYPYFVGLSSLNLIALLFGYSMQIFADFAGYSLIAIGLAKLFGYTLLDNFRFPYIAESFSEFWKRWHISLSTWLREYLYFPLGGNRKGRIRAYANLMVVMFLGGLWHGAAWSYAVWGTWHGVALAGERMVSNSPFYRSQKLAVRVLRTLLVFSFVSAAWLLFKLPRFADVLAFLGALRSNLLISPSLGGPMMIALYSLPVLVYHLHYLAQQELRSAARARLAKLSPPIFGFMIMMIALNSGPSAAFIYFQF